jgi:2-polyprenyl-3-methyl-5-hydroxy-6-metoxy-1,4-benzoquinol methylase
MVEPYVRGRVLDIGCGFTHLPDRLVADQTYVGVDVVAEAVRLSQARYPQHAFYHCDVDRAPLSLPLDGQAFDTILLMAVVEHLSSPREILRAVRPYLAPGGQLLLTTPSPLGDWVHRAGSRVKLFYPEHVVQHVKIFGRRALLELLTDCGFEVAAFHYFEGWINQLAVCRGRSDKHEPPLGEVPAP